VEAVPHFLQEVSRILRPGGLFLSADWGAQPTLHREHPSFAEREAYIPRTVSFFNAASCVGIPSFPLPRPRFDAHVSYHVQEYHARPSTARPPSRPTDRLL
jgi:SAM-dependent methyltransferase